MEGVYKPQAKTAPCSMTAKPGVWPTHKEADRHVSHLARHTLLPAAAHAGGIYSVSYKPNTELRLRPVQT